MTEKEGFETMIEKQIKFLLVISLLMSLNGSIAWFLLGEKTSVLIKFGVIGLLVLSVFFIITLIFPSVQKKLNTF
jgi:hypothetical protein